MQHVYNNHLNLSHNLSSKKTQAMEQPANYRADDCTFENELSRRSNVIP